MHRKRLHLYMAIFWIVMTVPTILWWKQSILWVACMSLYANIEASLSAYHAKTDKDEK